MYVEGKNFYKAVEICTSNLGSFILNIFLIFIKNETMFIILKNESTCTHMKKNQPYNPKVKILNKYGQI